MIRIEFHLRRGLFTGLRSLGHASCETGENGKNPVCAGVSTLVQTLFIHLSKHKLVDRFSSEKGEFSFELVDIRNPKLTVVVDNSYKMITSGLEEIQKKHPQEVALEYLDYFEEETKKVS